MIVSIGDAQLKFWFEHKPTTTLVYCEHNGIAYTGSAHLAKGDQYSKAIGRRVALARMLKTGLMKLEPVGDGIHRWVTVLAFSRDMRRIVWNTYFRTHADLKRRKEALATQAA